MPAIYLIDIIGFLNFSKIKKVETVKYPDTNQTAKMGSIYRRSKNYRQLCNTHAS